VTRKTAVNITVLLGGALSAMVGVAIDDWWPALGAACLTGAIIGLIFNRVWPQK
jgi:hypothetical protein